ncbi:hypothetical protein [Albibacillus kandeliae]|uniref:hypothetical protein n=1 Tax=Albibacillus kandeliae TaxID=2174228 RepID=UPI000D69D25B|nr:hypothetical protein [Albibacillus kandeliae]
MIIIKRLAVLAALAPLAACGANMGDMTADRGIDSKGLGILEAGIWVDPNGCDHWIIDDGLEGYMDARLDSYGRPVCSGIAPPNTAVGPFKDGSTVPDTI